MGTFWSGGRAREGATDDQGEGGARFKAGEGRTGAGGRMRRRGVRVASPRDGRKAGMFNDARGRVTRHVGPIERNQSGGGGGGISRKRNRRRARVMRKASGARRRGMERKRERHGRAVAPFLRSFYAGINYVSCFE